MKHLSRRIPVIIAPADIWYTKVEDMPMTTCRVMAHLLDCRVKAHRVAHHLVNGEPSTVVVPTGGWLLVWEGGAVASERDLPKVTLIEPGQTHTFTATQGCIWLPGWEA